MTPPITSPLHRIQAAVLEAWAVWSGIESGLFEALDQPARLEDLCARLDFEPLPLSSLARALLLTGYLEETAGDQLVVSWARRPFVLKESPQFMGSSLGFLRTAHLFEAYPRLLRGGGLSPSEQDWSLATQGSAAVAAACTAEIFSSVPTVRSPGARLLEVGCRQGDLSLGLSLAQPELEILAIDRNGALAQLAAQRHAANPCVRVMAADLYEVSEQFDVVVLNQVLNALGTERAQATIFESLARLTPGGVLVIVEPVDGGEDQAVFAGLMARLFFPHGEMFRREELLGLAANADLRARAVPIRVGSPELLLLVAQR